MQVYCIITENTAQLLPHSNARGARVQVVLVMMPSTALDMQTLFFSNDSTE